MIARRNPLPIAMALLALLASVPVAAQGQDSYAAALAKYEAYVQRPSLHKRTEGRRALATTLDPRALDVLAKDYVRPEEPTDVVRHLIVSLTMDAFGSSADEARLAAWRAKHDDDADAWLWHETLRPFADAADEDFRALVLGK